MRIKYKLLMLSPLFIAMPSCVSYTNVVKDRTDSKILIEDTKTKEERIFDLCGYNGVEINYVYTGDTIDVVYRDYKKKKVIEFSKPGIVLYTSADSIRARCEREKFECMKKQMQQEKAR